MLLDDNNKEVRDMVAGVSDEDVLAKSLRKPHLFTVLLDRYEAAFLRKAESILHNREAAEDAVQDAFVKIYRNAHRFTPQPGAGFKSWGYRILVNTCFTAYKKLKNEGVFLADLDPEIQELIGDKGVAEQAEQALNTDEVSAFLEKLPENLASVMRLHFIEGKPHAEVAKIVGISEGAVRARVHRAKADLRKLIAKRRAHDPRSM
ncbi:MAG: RNA polymerase sigma factor [bacterium]|nr:RNA polymerase sigma factor [bacterium]